MKRRTTLVGLLLTGLTLGLVGCAGEEPKVEPAHEIAKPKPGPAYDPGPIQPSPVPSMPPTGPSMNPVPPEGKMETPKPVTKQADPSPK